MNARCPYCAKEKGFLEPGYYKCSRCNGRFSITESRCIEKRGRATSSKWLIFASMITTALIIFHIMTQPPSAEREITVNIAFGFGACVVSAGFVLFSLQTNEVPSQGDAVYKEDHPYLYAVSIVFYSLMSFGALLVAILEGMGIAHFRF